jgi:MSHA biogenesis protein MshJ
MKQLVESLIAALPGLRLVQFRNDPPQGLEVDGAPAGAGAPGQVYRHGFTLTVEGNYGDLLQYLDRMETTGHRIYWKRVDIDASEYPADRMVIDFYTLSRDPTWLVL